MENDILTVLTEYYSPTTGVMKGQFAGLDLTNSGTVTFPAVGHLEASAALFNTSDNDFLYRATPAFVYPNSFSAWVWFKILTGSTGDRYIYSYYTQGENPNYPGHEMMWHSEAVAQWFHFQVATDAGYYYAYATGPVSTNEWHLAIGRYHYPTKTLKLRIDDVDQGTEVATGEITPYTDGLFDLSNFYNTNGTNLDGWINDMGLVNGYLTDMQCQQLWNSGSGLPFASFDDGSGGTERVVSLTSQRRHG